MKILVLHTLLLLTILGCEQQKNKREMNNENQAIVKIEIWSDVVCPFCFLGKKKIEQAITNIHAQDKVEIVWRSFQLDPTFPKKTAVPTVKNLLERKGYPIEQIKSMCDQLEAAGQLYGINFNFDNALTFNTLDAHRLIKWSESFGLSSELKEAIMKAHFVDGNDLSAHENLLSVAAKIGLNIDSAKHILLSKEYTTAVIADTDQATNLGIRGVPFFLINGNQKISGAQDVKFFENAISQALKEMKPTPTSLTNGVCIPKKGCD